MPNGTVHGRGAMNVVTVGWALFAADVASVFVLRIEPGIFFFSAKRPFSPTGFRRLSTFLCPLHGIFVRCAEVSSPVPPAYSRLAALVRLGADLVVTPRDRRSHAALSVRISTY